MGHLQENERKENKRVKDYLQMSYRLTNEYINKKWTDVKSEKIEKEVKTRQLVQGGMRFKDLQEM